MNGDSCIFFDIFGVVIFICIEICIYIKKDKGIKVKIMRYIFCNI